MVCCKSLWRLTRNMWLAIFCTYNQTWHNQSRYWHIKTWWDIFAKSSHGPIQPYCKLDTRTYFSETDTKILRENAFSSISVCNFNRHICLILSPDKHIQRFHIQTVKRWAPCIENIIFNDSAPLNRSNVSTDNWRGLRDWHSRLMGFLVQGYLWLMLLFYPITKLTEWIETK